MLRRATQSSCALGHCVSMSAPPSRKVRAGPAHAQEHTRRDNRVRDNRPAFGCQAHAAPGAEMPACRPFAVPPLCIIPGLVSLHGSAHGRGLQIGLHGRGVQLSAVRHTTRQATPSGAATAEAFLEHPRAHGQTGTGARRQWAGARLAGVTRHDTASRSHPSASMGGSSSHPNCRVLAPCQGMRSSAMRRPSRARRT